MFLAIGSFFIIYLSTMSHGAYILIRREPVNQQIEIQYDVKYRDKCSKKIKQGKGMGTQ